MVYNQDKVKISLKGESTMTNAQIIFTESQKLMEAGVIGSTGRTIKAVVIDKDGNEQEKEFHEPEPIHTYAGWKERGYQVQKGEKAIAQFVIWKQVTKKAKDESEQDEKKMFMKKASWFKFSQVQKIEGDN